MTDSKTLITDHDIARVRAANPIAEIITRNVNLGDSARQGALSGTCLFCENNSDDFHVSPQLGLWQCDDCGESGDVFAWVRKLDGVSFAEAVRVLADRAGVHLNPLTQEEDDAELMAIVKGSPEVPAHIARTWTD